ncbi:MAG: universal stress protein [Sutterellaceae bacterium]|nr:universal stress protein [Sutterellaceae bacterium]
MKILVPIDGSAYSENSLAFIASRTSMLGKSPEIELLVVLDPLPARAARLVGKESLNRYYEEEAEKVFEPARKFLKDHNVQYTEAFVVGDPSEKIAEEAMRMDADLVLMGSRGRTALAGLFLGSVTNGVLARTKNPILIIRNRTAPEKDAMRVGICVDGSKYGVAAVKYAIRHGELFGENAQFYLINVTSDYAGAIMPDMAGMALPALSEAEVVELQKTEFAEALDTIRPLLAKAGVTPKEVCLVGNPGDEIAAFAKKKKLDLVVMGSHGYGRFKSAVMGSTATRIAAQGDVPILLIRR